MKKLSLFFSCFLSFTFLGAQEVISILESNPLLQIKPNQQDQKMRTASAITLPFLDDFSYNSYFPNYLFWEDSSVFVNRSYPINPVTIGVATFDGLDASGMAYDISASTQGKRADSLTSRPIDLSVVDSAYLLFYYQAQGLGDNPQTQDSLILEFLSGIDTLGLPVWQDVWSVAGQTTQEFQKVTIKIKESNYLHSAFQFRFRNKATLSGNYDHWHIDYVKLDEYTAGQIPPINDVAFVYENPQLLKRYREMPWVQYLENTVGDLRDTLDIVLRNNDGGFSIPYRYDVYENNNLVEHYPYIGNTRTVLVGDYDSIGNFNFVQPPVYLSDTIFKSNSTDSATFLFRNLIEPGSLTDYNQNDTLDHFQIFNSHYAYDDGIAEFAYGINVQGAKMAYQFELNKADSLRMIQIYFAPMQNNVSNIPFHLVVWDDNSGEPGNVLHTETTYPVYEYKLNFHNYYLTEPIALDGIFYVGIQQTTNDMLNVGLDRNSPSNNYMFYDVGAGWNYSQFPGAWMIRPVLRSTPIISATFELNQKFDIQIYPNPFDDYTIIELNEILNNKVQLFDVSGRLLRNFEMQKNRFQLTKNNLKAGVYFLRIQNNKGIFRKKIVIQ
tara:strand:- start:468 stop:2294 length:1827 start_codon:yes stop_codon:yes gene_type:complete